MHPFKEVACAAGCLSLMKYRASCPDKLQSTRSPYPFLRKVPNCCGVSAHGLTSTARRCAETQTCAELLTRLTHGHTLRNPDDATPQDILILGVPSHPLLLACIELEAQAAEGLLGPSGRLQIHRACFLNGGTR